MSNENNRALARLVAEIHGCRICREMPHGTPLPHVPRPVLRPSSSARICISSQAPGVRVHASGTPFTDPSGDRLRAWLQLTPEEFYDQRRIAIVPMGFCFPGHDAAGGDRTVNSVWSYEAPIPEAAGITSLMCFYPERVELTVSGERQPAGKASH